MLEFSNIAPLDFSEPAAIDMMQQALSNFENNRNKKIPTVEIIIAGKKISTNKTVQRFDPSDKQCLIAAVHYANIEQAELALKSVQAGFPTWANKPFLERAQIIAKAGETMLGKRFDLAALIIRETGKTWKEADADVVEAIDFCNYYAHLASKLDSYQKTDEILGEENYYFYKPKGIALIIAPWNFPLAIACGMLTAALVTGNTAILKPAEQSSLIAQQLVEILLTAGVDQNALAFLPGEGEIIGSYLVEHSAINLIAFTGSRPVGLEILKKAAEVQPSQKHIKKVIAELGGKNSIIVDEDADLDQAIQGILYSAFAYAGQKCSACSRVIVVGGNYQHFSERLEAALQSIIIDRAANAASYLGPVIDAEAYDRISAIIRENKKLWKYFSNEQIPASGYFIAPTIFCDVDTQAPLWQEEVFGPVLAINNCKTFPDAINMALDSDYALTGGVYSRSPQNIKYSYNNFLVGNLYINRPCTGAIVRRQPFGGFKLSGIGSKAGGPDYLLQFLDPRCISENTMRRGFTPDLL